MNYLGQSDIRCHGRILIRGRSARYQRITDISVGHKEEPAPAVRTESRRKHGFSMLVSAQINAWRRATVVQTSLSAFSAASSYIKPAKNAAKSVTFV